MTKTLLLNKKHNLRQEKGKDNKINLKDKKEPPKQKDWWNTPLICDNLSVFFSRKQSKETRQEKRQKQRKKENKEAREKEKKRRDRESAKGESKQARVIKRERLKNRQTGPFWGEKSGSFHLKSKQNTYIHTHTLQKERKSKKKESIPNEIRRV